MRTAATVRLFKLLIDSYLGLVLRVKLCKILIPTLRTYTERNFTYRTAPIRPRWPLTAFLTSTILP